MLIHLIKIKCLAVSNFHDHYYFLPLKMFKNLNFLSFLVPSKIMQMMTWRYCQKLWLRQTKFHRLSLVMYLDLPI